eukprot:5298379-Karenia_brevis.AAC.1
MGITAITFWPPPAPPPLYAVVCTDLATAVGVQTPPSRPEEFYPLHRPWYCRWCAKGRECNPKP